MLQSPTPGVRVRSEAVDKAQQMMEMDAGPLAIIDQHFVVGWRIRSGSGISGLVNSDVRVRVCGCVNGSVYGAGWSQSARIQERLGCFAPQTEISR